MALTPAAHIAIVSSSGIGHLFPISELSKCLVRHHNIAVTIITQSLFPLSAQEQSFLDVLRQDIHIVTIPPPLPEAIPPTDKLMALIFFLVRHNLPNLRTILHSLTATATDSAPPLSALVLDMFFAEGTLDVAEELGLQPYLFLTSPCSYLSFTLHLPMLDATIQGQYTDITEPILLPGCVPLHGRDIPQPALERESKEYAQYLSLVKQYGRVKGILANSFEELEPAVLSDLKDNDETPRIYPVGPLVRPKSPGGCDGVLDWLDKQPAGSVLYISFGSGGALDTEQTKELALGLESSAHRFLWVVKKPNDFIKSATYFAGRSIEDSALDFLPLGFLDRTKDVGLLVPSWAPQVEVLGHPSTGGYLSHCGWNSTLESIVNGVPMIAWPLFAEQKMNAGMLVEGLEVALRPVAGETGVVGREEVARVVKCLMEEEEGKKVRRRMKDFSKKAARTLEEGGSSYTSLCSVVSEWKGLRGDADDVVDLP